MQEIKCPKCGEVFQVDEAGYAAIVKQVRDKEFNKELKEREAQFKIAKEDALEVAKTKAEKDLNQLIAQKDKEIADLQKKHDSESNETKLEIANLNAQIAAAESEKNTALEKAEAEKDRLISELNAKLQAKDDEQKHIVKEAEAEKDKIIAELQNQISNITKDHKHDMEQLKSAKQLEIDALSAQITNNETVKNLAVSEVETKYTKLLADKKEEIAKLNGDLESKNKELEIRENSIRREYDVIIKNKDEQIEQYRDFKARQSTKMIGESLEVHCSNEFNKVRHIGFPTAYFEKDNDARSGSKGDFIFKDFDDEGNEYISIMFEMKNEADATEKKHKNEDFFKELDKDRREKKCEYAVLVTLLEADNDYYYISNVFDSYFVYEGWCTDKIYRQGYTKDEDNVAFDGERIELFRELLTASEKAELESMRSNYTELKEFKENVEKNELHSKKESLLADEKYSVLSENEAFIELKKNMDNYSLDDLETKAKVIFADYVSSIGAFSAKPEVSKSPVLFMSNSNSEKESKKKAPYGGIFEKYNN